jgi:6-phosphogluconolactonase
MKSYELIPFDNPSALADAAAKEWLALCEANSSQSTPYLAALSGGRIAREFFSSVARSAAAGRISLSRVHFFWGDERCVPPQDAESNFKIANELLFQPLAIAPDHIHRIQGETDPQYGARQAEAELRRFASSVAEGQPVLDVVFLGMGEDGHVASLFPELPDEANNSTQTYLFVKGSKAPPQRITLSYAAIKVAREVWVLASGAGKAKVLQASLTPDGRTPLARVIKMRRQTRIFADAR